MIAGRAGICALAAGLIVYPTMASAQQLAGGAGFEVSLVRVFAALLVCIAAAFAVILLIRSRGGKARGFRNLASAFGRTGRIELIESRRLSPHADLCLFRCDETEYLVLCSAGHAQVLETKAASANHSTEGA